jgi:hypothetical protein
MSKYEKCHKKQIMLKIYRFCGQKIAIFGVLHANFYSV